MKPTINSFIFSILVFLFLAISCKKDETISSLTPEVEASPNVAPCAVQESVNSVNLFQQGGSNFFPDAQSHVFFQNIEFAFNHAIPPTGMYTLCHRDYPTADSIIENQIMFARDSGSFIHISTFSYDDMGFLSSEVYVENNENELIISFCEFEDTSVFFDITNNFFVGNNLKNLLYRNPY
ncbi:MAG: hypothetical protein HWE22_13650 [Flavobacteriales bacterium]|nr:hypothetical protein [Flavobacteriales bacterium]